MLFLVEMAHVWLVWHTVYCVSIYRKYIYIQDTFFGGVVIADLVFEATKLGDLMIPDISSNCTGGS
jgi:hypothetical protein